MARSRSPRPITVNADLLRQAGLVRDVRKPLKILGGGDLGVNVFVVADAFTKSAREKIESAGGTVQVIEIPTQPLAALGIERADGASAEPATEAKAPRASRARTEAAPEPAVVAEPEPGAEAPRSRKPSPRPRRSRARGRRGAEAPRSPKPKPSPSAEAEAPRSRSRRR